MDGTLEELKRRKAHDMQYITSRLAYNHISKAQYEKEMGLLKWHYQKAEEELNSE